MDLCHTWEVSPGRREQREESAEEEPPSFLPPVRMGCGRSDSAVQESKDWDAGVVGRKPLLKCSHRGMRWRFLDNEDKAFLSLHVICLIFFFFFKAEIVIVQLM